MKSKVIWGVLILSAAVLLVGGAVNRTMARSDIGSTVSGDQANQQQLRGQAVTIERSGTPENAAGQMQGPGTGNGGSGQGKGQGLGRGEQSGAASEETAGQGQTQGEGQGGGRGQGAAGNGGTVAPLAEVEELETIQGAVTEVNDELMLLTQEDGEKFEIGGRAWRFALDNDFTVQEQDILTVTGFYDQNHFESIAITNENSGQQVQLREATGRPLWAGEGRGRAGT